MRFHDIFVIFVKGCYVCVCEKPTTLLKKVINTFCDKLFLSEVVKVSDKRKINNLFTKSF